MSPKIKWYYVLGLILVIGFLSECTSAKKTSTSTAPGLADERSLVFRRNCSMCHSIDKELIGPPLRNIGNTKDTAWVIKFVHDSYSLKKAGDSIAVALEKSNNIGYEHLFIELSEEDIKSIIKYADTTTHR